MFCRPLTIHTQEGFWDIGFDTAVSQQVPSSQNQQLQHDPNQQSVAEARDTSRFRLLSR